MRNPDATPAARASASNVNLPTVSVIVPSYNYGHFLEGCVTSAVQQEAVDSRILVIDDGSTDDSAHVGRRLAEQNERVEFRQHTTNVGFIPTVNEGFEWAGGEYVVHLDADDLLLPGSLRRATRTMALHPEVGLTYGRALYAHEGRKLARPSARWSSTAIWRGADWLEVRCRSGHNCVSMPTAVMRRSVQQAVGGYRPECLHTPDMNLWLRMAAVSDIAHIRAHQAIYRVHASSMSHTQEGPLVPLRERRVGFDSFFADGARSLDDPERLHHLVSRALAKEALWRASRAVDRGGDEQLIAELLAFALDTFPESRRLREWRGFQLRRRIGSGRSLMFPPLLASGVAHRLRAHLGWTLLGYRGV
jgi:glycosyltransferase involved in cell wall biosynthesis